MTEERALRVAREHEHEKQSHEQGEVAAQTRTDEQEVAAIAQLARTVAAHLADLDYPGIQVVQRCERRRWWRLWRRRRVDDAGWEILSIHWASPEGTPIYLLANGELIVGDGHAGVDPIRWHPPTIRWSLEKLMAQHSKPRR